MNCRSAVLIASAFTFLWIGRAPAESPRFQFDCARESGSANDPRMTFNFNSKAASVLADKDKEPLWLNYDENSDVYAYCQQQSDYASKFKSALVKHYTKNRKPISQSNLSIDPLARAFVCVKYGKKIGYQYLGAMIFSLEGSHFPNPTDPEFKALFLSLDGKASDANLREPKILEKKLAIYSCKSGIAPSREASPVDTSLPMMPQNEMEPPTLSEESSDQGYQDPLAE